MLLRDEPMAMTWVGRTGEFPGWGPISRALSETELKKALSFKMPFLSERYASVHYEARLILSEAFGVKPEKIEIVQLPFSDGKTRKPFLLMDGEKWECSLSRSGLHFALAISNVPVGVDVEENLCFDESFFTSSFFSGEEKKSILESSAPDRTALRMWVRKEAMLKADGIGLLADRIDLVDSIRGRWASSGCEWVTRDIPCGDGLCCSLALPHQASEAFSTMKVSVFAPLRPSLPPLPR